MPRWEVLANFSGSPNGKGVRSGGGGMGTCLSKGGGGGVGGAKGTGDSTSLDDAGVPPTSPIGVYPLPPNPAPD